MISKLSTRSYSRKFGENFGGMNPKRVTLQDIARDTGFSVSAVSKALRGESEIPVATRETLRQRAEALGYRPNPLVSALMATRGSGKRRLTAVPLALISDIGDGPLTESKEPNTRQIAKNIHARAGELGFAVEEFTIGERGLGAERLAKILHTRSILGIVLETCRDYSEVMRLPLDKFCLIARGNNQYLQVFNSVTSEAYANMWLALSQAWELGYRRPALAIDSGTHSITLSRYRGAYLAFLESKTPARPLPLPPPYSHESSAQILQWFRKHQPDVIVGKHEIASLLAKNSIRIPEDIAYICVDHKPEFTHLAGVDSNMQAIGRNLVDQLVLRMERNEFGLPDNPARILVNGTWIPGPSCPPQSH